METIKQILLPTIATLIIIALFGITVPTTLFIATLIALTLISTLTSKPGYVRSTKSVQVDIVSNPMVQAFVSDCLELQEALPEEPSYERHAEVMRSLIRAGHLTVDDLKRSNSSRLFDIHRGGAFGMFLVCFGALLFIVICIVTVLLLLNIHILHAEFENRS
eukprot:TRINITY_DN2154_c0_g1_i2.p1 TRINITY_DN2154_c0_g1~~TRINITY_DN2154_c0_g1_i2.p1  ORF type:complete len:188 (-),score=8.23 TRINITY_DN2154_c0_g1_i2:368-853(-)